MSTPYDVEVDQDTEQYSKTFGDALNLSLRDHLTKQENTVRELLEDIDNSRKEVVELKREYTDMDHEYHSKNADTQKFVISTLDYLEGEFKKNLGSSKSELAFLRQQLNITKNERESLDTYVSKLENRVKHDEDVVGFKYQVPENEAGNQTL